MEKKRIVFVFLLVLLSQAALSQLFKFGIQMGPHYSSYALSEKNSAIEAVRGSIGFHSGFFVRKDFESFFIGADLTYSSYLGGTSDDGTGTFKC